MWPDEVERIAAPLRAAGVEARLEELAPGERAFPGVAARAVAYDCDGRDVVALVEASAEPDPVKVARAAGARLARPSDRTPAFPFEHAARVLLEQLLLTGETVWVEAGSPRHFLGLSPTVLAQVTRAAAADLSREG